MPDEEDFPMEPIVGSSRISAMGYDPSTKRMRCEFPNGALYEYSDVTAEVYHAVRFAPSVGSAFQSLIVGGGLAYERIA